MARQNKTLPARRQDAVDDSLLIRSAESLGRMIGSLQRQLEAARHLTDRADGAEFRGNGHVPARQSGGTAKTQRRAKTQRKTKSAQSDAGTKHAAADRKSKRAAKSAAAKTAGRNRSGAKQRAAKASRGR